MREPEELRPEHFQELKEDQTARSVYMGEILAELRAEPASLGKSGPKTSTG